MKKNNKNSNHAFLKTSMNKKVLKMYKVINFFNSKIKIFLILK